MGDSVAAKMGEMMLFVEEDGHLSGEEKAQFMEVLLTAALRGDRDMLWWSRWFESLVREKRYAEAGDLLHGIMVPVSRGQPVDETRERRFRDVMRFELSLK